ncbi:hypothetical protein J6590_002062 [Homalodisca vitripennis]|nr:hypothetical protein J6590_002062 [Homalodisca vitripennis]
MWLPNFNFESKITAVYPFNDVPGTTLIDSVTTRVEHQSEINGRPTHSIQGTHSLVIDRGGSDQGMFQPHPTATGRLSDSPPLVHCQVCIATGRAGLSLADLVLPLLNILLRAVLRNINQSSNWPTCNLSQVFCKVSVGPYKSILFSKSGLSRVHRADKSRAHTAYQGESFNYFAPSRYQLRNYALLYLVAGGTTNPLFPFSVYVISGRPIQLEPAEECNVRALDLINRAFGSATREATKTASGSLSGGTAREARGQQLSGHSGQARDSGVNENPRAPQNNVRMNNVFRNGSRARYPACGRRISYRMLRMYVNTNLPRSAVRPTFLSGQLSIVLQPPTSKRLVARRAIKLGASGVGGSFLRVFYETINGDSLHDSLLDWRKYRRFRRLDAASDLSQRLLAGSPFGRPLPYRAIAPLNSDVCVTRRLPLIYLLQAIEQKVMSL